jgi:hypothetical protein
MSEIKVIKKKSLANREPAPGPLSELFTSAIPFVTFPFALIRGGMGVMSDVFGIAAGLEHKDDRNGPMPAHKRMKAKVRAVPAHKRMKTKRVAA